MKNRNLILSVLCWLVASVAMAVSLPTSSYNAFDGSNLGNESYTLGIGVSFRNTAILTSGNEISTASDVVCTPDPSTSKDEVYSFCSTCCTNNVFYPCLGELGEAGASECEKRNYSCVQSCENSHSLPLGTPLMLLPFIAVYAVIRKRKQA